MNNLAVVLAMQVFVQIIIPLSIGCHPTKIVAKCVDDNIRVVQYVQWLTQQVEVVDHAWVVLLFSVDHAWVALLSSVDHDWVALLSSVDHAWVVLLSSVDHAWVHCCPVLTCLSHNVVQC